MMSTVKKRISIQWLLILFTLYQFLMGLFFIKNSTFYIIVNPYTLFSILFFIFLVLLLKKNALHKKLILPLMLFNIIIILSFFKYFHYPVNPLDYIKGLQYFYGIVFVIIGIYFILSKKNYQKLDMQYIYKRFITILLLSAIIVTILEFMYHNIFHLPWENLGYITTVENEYAPSNFIQIRPFGILSYPQPNGVVLTVLTYLYYLNTKKVNKLFFLGMFSTLLSMTGTGIMIFFLFLPLFAKNTFKVSIIVLLSFIAISFILVNTYKVFPEITIFSRLSADRFILYFNIFIDATFYKYLIYFTDYQILFGVDKFTTLASTGVTHDWGYFDVFYGYGLIGMMIYIILYMYVIFHSVPLSVNKNKKIYFTIIVLIANLHYPIINFYVGQFLFAILFVLNIFIRRKNYEKI